MYLSKDAILKSDDLKRADVDCPEWGGTVLVRELTARERDSYEGALIEGSQLAGKARADALENVNARIAALGIIDESGVRMFPDVTDVLALGEKSAEVVSRLADKIGELSGMGAKAKAETAGNSDAAPSGDSESASPETSDSSPTSSSTD